MARKPKPDTKPDTKPTAATPDAAPATPDTHGGLKVGDAVLMGTRAVRVCELVADGRVVVEYHTDADPRNPLSKPQNHRVPVLPQHLTKAK